MVRFDRNAGSAKAIEEHFYRCGDSFLRSIQSRIDVSQYASKIVTNAERFEAWEGGELIGLLAAYCNARDVETAFITNVSVEAVWRRKGICTALFDSFIGYVVEQKRAEISLEVIADNIPAMSLYGRYGFALSQRNGSSVVMTLTLRT